MRLQSDDLGVTFYYTVWATFVLVLPCLPLGAPRQVQSMIKARSRGSHSRQAAMEHCLGVQSRYKFSELRIQILPSSALRAITDLEQIWSYPAVVRLLHSTGSLRRSNRVARPVHPFCARRSMMLHLNAMLNKRVCGRGSAHRAPHRLSAADALCSGVIPRPVLPDLTAVTATTDVLYGRPPRSFMQNNARAASGYLTPLPQRHHNFMWQIAAADGR